MSMTSDEYAALRQTIRERGTARMVLVPFVFLGWAACAVATAAVITVAISTLVPLLVLAAGFEAIFALHVNVERVGRYLQVFHEQDGAGWEHVAMRFGQAFPGAGPDALFSRLFVLTASINFLPAVLGGTWPELALVGGGHLALIYRIRVAQRLAAAQRAADLERFTALRDAGPSHP
jgi:cell division protein FtsW (lipid II flippase)